MKKFFFYTGLLSVCGLVSLCSIFFFFQFKAAENRLTWLKVKQKAFEKQLNLFQHKIKKIASPAVNVTNGLQTPNNQQVSSAPSIRRKWIDIHKKVKDTVVQVYSNISMFNWLEPYKSPYQVESVGSGFFINENGDFVTNYHVVEGAAHVDIQIPSFGMRRFSAEIIGVSPERDLALLRLTKESKEEICKKLTPIPFLELGDSDEIIRSQEILALGFPLGQTRLKSTLGIVSGRERLGYFGYIQVTTPLNPGNSGGPALDDSGRVVGVNARGVVKAQNVGYIIPINELRSVLHDLPSVKLLRKPILGCLFTSATSEMVRYLNNPGDGGWYIARVFDNTLLKSIGVQKDDMLYEVNGYKIDIYGELNVPWSEDKVSLFELLNRYKIGDELNFLIYRKGKQLTFTFKLVNTFLPSIRTVYPEFEKQCTEYEIIGGLVVMPLCMNHINILLPKVPSLVKYLKAENQHKNAIVITHVFPNSQAYSSRVLSPGQIIETVNDQKVETLDDFRAAVLASKGKDFITIKTEDSLLAILAREKVLKDEALLSSQYFYQKSPLVDELS